MMNKYKKLIIKSFTLCVGLWVVRLLISGKTDYFFLTWNLFLGLIPLIIAIKFNTMTGKKLALGLFLWLFFLPNSFYVITDLIHLNSSQVHAENLVGPHINYDNIAPIGIVYDSVFIFFFGFVSFIYGLESVRLFVAFINKQKLGFKKIVVVNGVLFLSAIGIYLGRFVRFNTWDIIIKPWKIVVDSFQILLRPSEHAKEWLVIGLFYFGILVLFEFYETLLSLSRRNSED